MSFKISRIAAAVAVAVLSASGAVSAADVTVTSSTQLTGRNEFAPADANNNTVKVSGLPSKVNSSDALRIYGASTTTQDASGNNLDLTGLTIRNPVYHAVRFSGAVGRADENAGRPELRGNKVVLKNTTLVIDNDHSYGDVSEIIGAGTRKTLEDANQSWYKDKYKTWGTTAISNSVEISDSTLGGLLFIAGGVGQMANMNTVTLGDGVKFEGLEDASEIYGGIGYTATENQISITNANLNFNDADIVGGNGEAAASKNKVVVTGGTLIDAGIYGGQSEQNVIGNSVIINDVDTLYGVIVGGEAAPGTPNTTGIIGEFTHNDENRVLLSNNSVSISNLKDGADLEVIGGSVDTFLADTKVNSSGSSVAINNSTVANVYGDAVIMVTDADASVSELTASPIISLTNTTSDNVYAVAIGSVSLDDDEDDDDLRTASGKVFGTVDLTGSKIVLKNATVLDKVGGLVYTEDGETFGSAAGKTGTVTGSVSLVASGVNRIGTLSDDIKNVTLNVGEENKTKPVITFTGSPVVTYDAEGSSLTLTGMNITVNRLSGEGDDYALIGADGTSVTVSGTVNYDSTFTRQTVTMNAQTIASGETLTTTGISDNGGSTNPGDNTTKPTTTLTTNAKTLSESLLGSVALINQGAEFIASEGLSAINAAARPDGVNAFGAVSGGSVRYETGSHVDVDGGSLVLGAATEVNGTTLAAFAEAGWADSEAHVKNTKADGDHDYYGLGIAARYDFATPFYVEGSVRAGYSKTEFDGYYGSTGEKAHYDAKSFYTSFHVAGGYIFDVTESLKVDTYGRYLVSYLDSDTVRLSTAAHDKLKLDSTTTQTIQIGTKVLGTINENAAWRVGAAYEHVFGGDADAWVNGLKISSPSVSGNSGIFEAGMTVTPSAESPWKMDFGVKGYVGDRQGVTGSMQIQYLF